MDASAQAETGWSDLLAEGRLPRFALICLGVWLNAADSLVTATIMPSVGAELGGYAYFSWAVAGFLIGAILAGASAGRLSEVLGLRLATVIAGLVLAAGCVLSAAAPDIGFFLAGRLLQGVGCGWTAGFAMVAVAVLFPERHVARVFACMAAIWGIATILGPLIGGVFAETGDWRLVFWLFAAQAVLFSAAAPFLLKGTTASENKTGIPWAQLVVLGLGVAAISLADMTAHPAMAFALVLAGLAILLVVLRIDDRAAIRLLPHRAGDLSTICGSGYAALFALVACSMGLTVYGPAILQALHGLSPLVAGYVVGLEALAWTLAAFTVAGINGGPAERQRIRMGAGAILVSVVMLAVFFPQPALWPIILAAIVMGAGFGLSSSLINRRILGAVSNEDRAIAASAVIAVRQTGGAVGAAIAGATANLVGFGSGLTTASAEATALWIFVIALPLAVGGFWSAWRLSGTAVKA